MVWLIIIALFFFTAGLTFALGFWVGELLKSLAEWLTERFTALWRYLGL